jgi:hypothetical protein
MRRTAQPQPRNRKEPVQSHRAARSQKISDGLIPTVLAIASAIRYPVSSLSSPERRWRGRGWAGAASAASPDKSLVVAAIEKVPAPNNKTGKHGHAVKRQHGFFAGNARIAVLPAATGAELGAFLKANVAARMSQPGPIS